MGRFPLRSVSFLLGPSAHPRTHTHRRAAATATLRNLLDRSVACSITAQLVATKHRLLHPSAVTDSRAVRCACRLRAAGSCDRPQSATESFLAPATADGVPRLLGTHTCGTIAARGTLGLSSARCGCAAQRGFARLAPLSPLLRFGPALIAHHRTGLIPACVSTAIGPAPHPRLTGTVSMPAPTSAPGTSP